MFFYFKLKKKPPDLLECILILINKLDIELSKLYSVKIRLKF